MPSRWHGRPRLPFILSRLIRFGLIESSRWGFATEYENPSVQSRCSDTASSCRHRCAGAPAVGFRIVLFIVSEVCRIASIDSAADGIKLSFDNTDRQMISGRRHRSVLRPSVSRWVVGLVGASIFPVVSDTANSKNFVTHNSHGQSTTRCRHRRTCPPLIGHRIILINGVHGIPPTAISANHVNLSSGGGSADVVQRGRQGSAAPPAICGRIKFFNEIATLAEAADDINFSNKLDHRHLGARGWHRRARSPFSLALPICRAQAAR